MTTVNFTCPVCAVNRSIDAETLKDLDRIGYSCERCDAMLEARDDWHVRRVDTAARSQTANLAQQMTAQLAVSTDGESTLLDLTNIGRIHSVLQDQRGEKFPLHLEQCQHLLVAGGSEAVRVGFLEHCLAELVTTHAPQNFRFVMINQSSDATTYRRWTQSPHRLGPIITEADEVGLVLEWLCAQTDRRAEYLRSAGHRSVAKYYDACLADHQAVSELPLILVVIDDLESVMALGGHSEKALIRLTAKGAFVGIHLIAGCARPSESTLTELLMTNISSRLCFQVRSSAQSRLVLDATGGEAISESRVAWFRGAYDEPLQMVSVVNAAHDVSDDNARDGEKE